MRGTSNSEIKSEQSNFINVNTVIRDRDTTGRDTTGAAESQAFISVF